MISKLNATTGRLLIAALCIAATQLGVWGIRWDSRSAAAQAEAFDAATLPLEIKRWSGTPTELDPRVFQKLGASSMVNRSYQNALGRQASVHVSAFSATREMLPHVPRECYPGAGWTILKDDWQTGAHDRRYRLMVVEQPGARAIVAYWYQLGADVAAEQDDLRKILQSLRWQGKAWPAIVKVLIQVPVEFSDADARKSVEELGAEIYEWIKDNS